MQVNNINRINEIDKTIRDLQAEKEALIQKKNMIHQNKKVNDFLCRNSGQSLLKNHKLDEYGTWEVRGEDPNCDFGGSHHMPHLGYFEGTLENVLIKAVELPNFWQWGAGGEIKKVEAKLIIKV